MVVVRLGLAVVLVAAALVALPPSTAHAPPEGVEPDAFCIVVIQPLDDFRQVRITVDENLTKAAKDAFFAEADVIRDGRINATEARAFTLGQTEFWEGGLDMGNSSLYLASTASEYSITAVRPVYATTWRHLGHGFYEDIPTNATVDVDYASFETQEVREYGFQTAPVASRVVLHGADPTTTAYLGQAPRVRERDYDDDVTAVIEYVVVKAPPGWHIRTVAGQTYGGPFYRYVDTERFDMSGFDTSEPWQITFERVGLSHEDASGPAPVAFVVLLVAALAVARRGRRYWP